MPQLGDPNFHRTVVLMIEHSDEGAMGLVLNRASPMTLRDLARGQKLRVATNRGGDQVYVGGPVEQYRGFVLHDWEGVQERLQVMPGLYLSVTSDALQGLLLAPAVRMRFCLGYSGWGPKQLEKEVSAGAWLFTEAQPNITLDGNPDGLWGDTLKGMGVDPAMLMVSGGIN